MDQPGQPERVIALPPGGVPAMLRANEGQHYGAILVGVGGPASADVMRVLGDAEQVIPINVDGVRMTARLDQFACPARLVTRRQRIDAFHRREATIPLECCLFIAAVYDNEDAPSAALAAVCNAPAHHNGVIVVLVPDARAVRQPIPADRAQLYNVVACERSAILSAACAIVLDVEFCDDPDPMI